MFETVSWSKECPTRIIATYLHQLSVFVRYVALDNTPILLYKNLPGFNLLAGGKVWSLPDKVSDKLFCSLIGISRFLFITREQ